MHWELLAKTVEMTLPMCENGNDYYYQEKFEI